MANQQSSLSLAEQQLELAFDRTIWAAERTLMAWMRSSLTLITFGFAIERIFAESHLRMMETSGVLFRESGIVGLIMVVLGVVVMNVAMMQHLKILKYLESKTNRRLAKWSLGLFATVMLQLLGILIVTFILFNLW